MFKKNGKPYSWANKMMEMLLAIKSTDNDILTLENDQMMAILKVEPIDFPKLSASKQQKVMKHYGEWIDSLDHPVQIVSRSVNMDFFERLKIHLSKIEHDIKENPDKKDLLLLFREFSAWLDKTMEKHPNRLFFIVVPYTPEKKDFISRMKMHVKREKEVELKMNLMMLDERLKSTVEMLSKTGVKVTRMTTGNINEMLLSYVVLCMQSGMKNNLRFESSNKWFNRFKESVIEV